MKKIIYILAVIAIFTSCNKDFLDVKPKTEFSDDNFWTSESNLKSFSFGLYSTFKGYGQGSYFGGDHFFTVLTDDVLALRGDLDFPHEVPATSSQAGWDWTMIRKANILIDGAKKASVSTEVKNEYIGVGRFFRALLYWEKVEKFGDVPFYNKPIDSSDEEALYKGRDSRVVVIDSILADLNFAVEHLSADPDKVMVTKWTALAAKSRVCLYAGTMLKYHGVDAAKSKVLLQASLDASKEIMNSGKFALAANYSNIFNSQDLTGSPEAILVKKYNQNFSHSIKSFIYHEPYIGFSNSAASAFLMKDGKPVKYDGANHPGYTEWVFNTTDEMKTSLTEYKTHVGVADGRDERMAAIIDTTRLVFLLNGGIPVFSPIKYTSYNEDENRPTQGVRGESDAPIYRYGEVLLNYAEAAFELGVCDQTVLDNTINLLRDRAKVAHLTVAVGFDAADRDPSVDPLLWEIRRERRIELMLEPSRLNDLNRWKKGEYYDAEDSFYGVKIDPAVTFEAGIDPIKTADGHLYLVKTTDRRKPWEDKKYLYPLPADQLVLNPNLLPQNTGW